MELTLIYFTATLLLIQFPSHDSISVCAIQGKKSKTSEIRLKETIIEYQKNTISAVGIISLYG